MSSPVQQSVREGILPRQCRPVYVVQHYVRRPELRRSGIAIKMQNVYMIYGGTNFGHTGYSREASSLSDRKCV